MSSKSWLPDIDEDIRVLALKIVSELEGSGIDLDIPYWTIPPEMAFDLSALPEPAEVGSIIDDVSTLKLLREPVVMDAMFLDALAAILRYAGYNR